MTFAARAGASGFLAGRALWADLIEPYPDQTEVIKNLKTIGAQRINKLEEIVMRFGEPWRAHYDWSKGLSLSEHY
jgi:tagatose 1,6-diphosphate aldolase